MTKQLSKIELSIHNGTLVENSILKDNPNLLSFSITNGHLYCKVLGDIGLLHINYSSDLKHGASDVKIDFLISNNLTLIENVENNVAKITHNFMIADNIKFTHYICNLDVSNNDNTYTANINLETRAMYKSHLLNVFNKQAEIILHVNLNGKHAESNVFALNYANNKNNLKTSFFMNHNNSNTVSETLSHALADDHASSFTLGKIFVKESIKDVKAALQIKNLLCSKYSSCNSLPQLEIYSRHVQCSHGATNGKLSEEALHYMASRGISIEDAKLLLIRAFVGQILDNIELLDLQQALYSLLKLRIPE